MRRVFTVLVSLLGALGGASCAAMVEGDLDGTQLKVREALYVPRTCVDTRCGAYLVLADHEGQCESLRARSGFPDEVVLTAILPDDANDGEDFDVPAEVLLNVFVSDKSCATARSYSSRSGSLRIMRDFDGTDNFVEGHFSATFQDNSTSKVAGTLQGAFHAKRCEVDWSSRPAFTCNN